MAASPPRRPATNVQVRLRRRLLSSQQVAVMLMLLRVLSHRRARRHALAGHPVTVREATAGASHA